MQLKSGLLFLLAALTAAGLIGCQQYLPAPTPPDHRGVTLRIACPSSLVDLIAIQTRAWQARQQARVDTTVYQALRNPSDADIWLIRPADLALWASAGQLQPVPAALQVRGNSYVWEGLLPGFRQQLLSWDRQSYAMPLLGESAVCVYRSDVFTAEPTRALFEQWQKKRGLEAILPLRPPSTWEDFALFAEFFRDHHPSGKPGPSLPPLPVEDEALDALFYQVASSYCRRGIPTDEPASPSQVHDLFSFHCDHQTGKPRLGSPGFVAALELLARLQKCRPTGRQAQPEQALLSGQAILGVVSAGVLLQLQQQPALRDRFAVAALPGVRRYYRYTGEEQVVAQGVNRVPYLGGAGWLAVVSAKSTNTTAAFDLLADLTGPARSAQMVLEPRWNGGPTRSEQLLRERWDAFDLDPAQTRNLRDTLERSQLQFNNLKNPVYCLRVPDQADRRAKLVAALEGVLLKQTSAAEALAEVDRQWQQLSQARGLERAATEYRLSVGLLGQ